MIRMITSHSSAQAKAYFKDALSKSDYYTSDQELPGLWQGRLAERIGLDGLVQQKDFYALCDNLHPLTDSHLTPRTKDERRTGYDINFHCPKSVSVLHALYKDDHILTAFQESVTETMQHIEADAMTRVRKDDQNTDRKTGELVWGQFVHQTARPVEGYLPDPHLHSHCFVFNVTWDAVEGKYKAGQFGDIKRDMPYYQARFHKVFADRLTELGYQVKQTDKSFEIEHVPHKVTDLFSKRTDEIGRFAKEHHITDQKELAELGARTRAKKQKGHTMAELKKSWLDQIKALGTEGGGDMGEAVRFAHVNKAPVITPQGCIDFAVLHSFERASVMPDRRLLEAAFRHSIGMQGATPDKIEKAFKEDSRIIHVNEKSRTLCTTKDVLKEEKQMVELARQGQGKMKSLYKEAPELSLKGQQAEAVRNVLTTQHRVSIIRGAAGAGKTTLMKEAVSKIEAAGKQVTVLAPSAEASRGTLKDEGFKDADTVARFLVSPSMQGKIKGQVLWVDEAGLLGTKDMKALLEIATKQDARLILGGDTRQHASVVRGDALRILNTVAGIKPAEVSKNYRQRNEDYKKAVEDIAKGDMHSGFEKLDKIGAIKTIDPNNATQPLVNDYLKAIRNGKSALVISPTHAQGEKLTHEIRESLKQSGAISKKEKPINRLTSLNFTEAQKSDARTFAQGQVVQFVQNVEGFTRGSQWTVKSNSQNKVLVKNEKGEEKDLPLDKPERFQVYERSELNLSKGDKVRITNGGFDKNDKRLNNGQLLEVISVSKNGEVVLKNDISHVTYELKKDFGHLSHAYVLTSHASQGKTVDEVFIFQPASTFGATDAKQFYVSVSRGCDQAHIYTDDKEELLNHAKDTRHRQSALELIRQSKATKDFMKVLPTQQQTKEKPKSNIKTKDSHAPEI